MGKDGFRSMKRRDSDSTEWISDLYSGTSILRVGLSPLSDSDLGIHPFHGPLRFCDNKKDNIRHHYSDTRSTKKRNLGIWRTVPSIRWVSGFPLILSRKFIVSGLGVLLLWVCLTDRVVFGSGNWKYNEGPVTDRDHRRVVRRERRWSDPCVTQWSSFSPTITTTVVVTVTRPPFCSELRPGRRGEMGDE